MSAGASVPETYFDLVRAFPLTVIRDERQRLRAIHALLAVAHNPEPGAMLYKAALETLIWAYEDTLKDTPEEE